MKLKVDALTIAMSLFALGTILTGTLQAVLA
jgi:hypothetical protein